MRTFTRVLFIALLSTSAYAQQATPPQNTDQPSDTAKNTDTSKSDTTKTAATKGAEKEKLSQENLQTLAKYHHVNQMEIELGKAAQKQGGSQAVKQYGKMLVNDHQANDKKLEALAKKDRQKIPTFKPETDTAKQEMQDAKQTAQQLKKMKGADFDRQFLQTMIDQHEQVLAGIDNDIAQANNDQIADLLRDTKPVLQKHADRAREIQQNKAQAMNQPGANQPGANKPEKQPETSARK